MTVTLLLEHALNGLQFGLMLFLLAAGLTLIFGIMDFINLAHGSLYMAGAYFCATFTAWLDSFLLGLVVAVAATALLGAVLERIVFSRLYARDHLSHVLATFALILIFNDTARLVWGAQPLMLATPDWLAQPVPLWPGFTYPAFRLFIIAVGVAVAGLLYLLVVKTRLGMQVRAGASNREMVKIMGVNINRLFTLLVALGAGLCAVAGSLLGSVLSVQVGMGESILILAFVVIVIGGIGSVRGALVGALLVGLVDTLSRSLLPKMLQALGSAEMASTLGPTLGAIMTYALMVGVLYFKPQGLFPARG